MGMSRVKAILYVILPQALRLVIPSWSNELIYSIKYSSLAYFITLPELTFVGKKVALNTARTFEAYLVVAAIYLVIVIVVSRLLTMLENRVRVPGLGVSHGHR
jgi:polar amino acid transport system permease protein